MKPMTKDKVIDKLLPLATRKDKSPDAEVVGFKNIEELFSFMAYLEKYYATFLFIRLFGDGSGSLWSDDDDSLLFDIYIENLLNGTAKTLFMGKKNEG